MWTTFLLIALAFPLLYFLTKRKTIKGYPPGPTGIPIFGYLPWLRPRSHVELGKLGKKYGNIFSVQVGSFSIVVLNDLESVRGAFKLDAFTGRPNHLLRLSLVRRGVTNNDGKEWLEQRRFALKTLKDIGLRSKSMEDSIQEECNDLVNYFRARAGKPIPMQEVFCVSLLNALWAIVTGEKFSLDDPEPRLLFKTGKKDWMSPDTLGPLYMLPWLAKMFPKSAGLVELEKSVKSMKNMVKGVVLEHQRTFVYGSPRDYIDLYLEKMADTTDPASSFYQQTGTENLVDVLLSFFIGGTDTTTSTMEFIILYLLTYPNVLRKVQAEIDSVVGPSRVPKVEDRPRMPYLNAVIQESQRFSSASPRGGFHSTTEDTDFMGFHLPKGTIVTSNLYQIHNNVDYWKDPEVFRPERFINEDGSFRKDENVVAFSIGKRVCLAENLAMTQLFLFLSNILQVFDLKVDPNHPLPGLEPRKSGFVLSPDAYMAVLTER